MCSSLAITWVVIDVAIKALCDDSEFRNRNELLELIVKRASSVIKSSGTLEHLGS